jgi:hypothetical protein
MRRKVAVIIENKAQVDWGKVINSLDVADAVLAYLVKEYDKMREGKAEKKEVKRKNGQTA